MKPPYVMLAAGSSDSGSEADASFECEGLSKPNISKLHIPSKADILANRNGVDYLIGYGSLSQP